MCLITFEQNYLLFDNYENYILHISKNDDGSFFSRMLTSINLQSRMDKYHLQNESIKGHP